MTWVAFDGVMVKMAASLWASGARCVPSATVLLFLLGSLSLSGPAQSQAQQDYLIQPGDILVISVWREPDLVQDVVVRPDGKFSYPLVGDIIAYGNTIESIRTQIVERIEQYIPDPVVTVQLRQIVGNSIYVLGQVNRPGMFVMTRPMDVMQALAMAGGTSTFAALNKIKVLRRGDGSQLAIDFRYGDIEDGKHLDQNILLQPGDVVVVP